MSYYLIGSYDKKATQVCPCGYLGDSNGRCRSTSEQIARYRNRISGPPLDRIDMHIEVPRLAHKNLRNGQTSKTIKRIEYTRARQIKRGTVSNVELTN